MHSPNALRKLWMPGPTAEGHSASSHPNAHYAQAAAARPQRLDGLALLCRAATVEQTAEPQM
eukprot:15452698-Alexandrium_andersonii.AAC.1